MSVFIGSKCSAAGNASFSNNLNVRSETHNFLWDKCHRSSYWFSDAFCSASCVDRRRVFQFWGAGSSAAVCRLVHTRAFGSTASVHDLMRIGSIYGSSLTVTGSIACRSICGSSMIGASITSSSISTREFVRLGSSLSFGNGVRVGGGLNAVASVTTQDFFQLATLLRSTVACPFLVTQDWARRFRFSEMLSLAKAHFQFLRVRLHLDLTYRF